MFITLTYKNLPLNCYEVHICHFYQNKCFALEVVSDSTHLSYFNKYIDRVWDYKLLFSPSTRPNSHSVYYEQSVAEELRKGRKTKSISMISRRPKEAIQVVILDCDLFIIQSMMTICGKQH